MLGSQKAFQLLCLVLFFLDLLANFSLSFSSSVTQLCSQNEASALIQFKSSFSIGETGSGYCYYVTGIKYYLKTDSWKEDTDCCSWDGVTCDIKGQVIGLDLSCSWLYGTIPSNSSLFHLPHLQKLNLAFNDFNLSKMSSKFGEFASLVYLNLSGSNFAGKIPSQVSHMSKLVSLDLSKKFYKRFSRFWYIDGVVDQALELDKHTLEGLIHNLTEVRQLVLDGTKMSSINPNVFMNLSSSLRSISLYDCGLLGKFPENIFHLPNLKLLKLGDNVNLSLSFPQFNQSSRLEFLDLSSMPLSKELFESVGNLVHLEHLDVSAAFLSEAKLPESIGNLIFLKHLDLRWSQVSGSIPTAMGNLSKLNHLDLRENNIKGKIPSSFTNLTKLEFLDLGDNQLEGSIPDQVSSFPNLITLRLSSNLLNGTLPSWLYTISSLEYILLFDNQFSGQIKEFQYNSLREIYLQNNKFQGPLPSSISQFVNLTVLYLQSNNLSGIVQYGMFSKLQHLQFLHLSANSLSLDSKGPNVDYTLPNLQSLFLSSCNVNEIPQFLRESKGLAFLDLSDNRISGKIPKWMQDVGKKSLSYLNLSHNSLTDFEQLPWKGIEMFDLSSNLIHGDLPIAPSTAYAFFISNNSLSGEISSLICNASSIEFLDLSRNNLSGTIPRCLGKLSLSSLNLRMNKFHGIIPSTFTERCQLKNLNLNGNKLEGPLPRSIINCRGLEVLDLGNNRINDTFPHWLGSLPQLLVLVLSANQLQGSIHDTDSGTSFSKIQIFDLSSNYFTGTLPVRYIKNFNAMKNLTNNESALHYIGVSDGRNLARFYSYSVGIAIKGVEMEVVKIFTKLTTIDLSNNNFQGEIPIGVGKLSSLKGFNFSHNNLSGSIPSSMGDLVNLEWLDLSSNKLVGAIPERLVDLTFLSIFNVSENQLHGQIPQGKQFNTFGNNSYEGNNGLCGFPVSKGCNNSEPPPSNFLQEDGSDSKISFGWKPVLIGYGCGVIFGLAMGYVAFETDKPKWFVTLVKGRHKKRQKMSKTGNRRRGGRRI